MRPRFLNRVYLYGKLRFMWSWKWNDLLAEPIFKEISLNSINQFFRNSWNFIIANIFRQFFSRNITKFRWISLNFSNLKLVRNYFTKVGSYLFSCEIDLNKSLFIFHSEVYRTLLIKDILCKMKQIFVALSHIVTLVHCQRSFYDFSKIVSFFFIISHVTNLSAISF